MKEPIWEQGALDDSEWETPLITQDEVVSDAHGVALVSRATFLTQLADFVVSTKPLAVILPGLPQWVRDAERSDAARTLSIRGSKSISRTYIKRMMVRE